MAAVDAVFEDCDYEDLEKVFIKCNEDVLKEHLDEEDFEEYEDSLDVNKDMYEKIVKSMEEEFEEAKDEDVKLDVSYEVVASDVYDKKDDGFDSLIGSFTFKDTDMEDYIDEAARVSILMIVKSKDDDGNKRSEADILEFRCYKIDGDWYIDNFPAL